MIKQYKRYLSLYFKMLMQSFKTMLEYKGDFILLMVTTIVGQMSGLFFIYLIYQKVPTIAGWSFWKSYLYTEFYIFQKESYLFI